VSADDLEGRADLLSRFMLQGYSDRQLRDQVINFVLAGRDTTAILLTWTLFELAQRPAVVESLRTEADACGKRSTNAEDAYPVSETPSSGPLGFEDLARMPYLKATLTEVMRLHPSVPLDFKMATRADTLPDGTAIRRGERVMFVAYAMGRLPALWPEPERFDPSRHLDPATGAFKFPSPHTFPVFLAGPRTCLGKDMAYLGAGLILTALLSRFDISLADPPERVQYDLGLTLWTTNGVSIRFKERSF